MIHPLMARSLVLRLLNLFLCLYGKQFEIGVSVKKDDAVAINFPVGFDLLR